MRFAVAIAYLALAAAYSYLVWGPWDGTYGDPMSWSAVAALLLVHVLAGAAIGRWWAVLLPLGWSAVSVPAGGYDTPVSIIILFQATFFWAPALALGVAIRRFAWARLRAS